MSNRPRGRSTGSGASRSWLRAVPGWTARLATIGTLPGDSEEERLAKASFTLMVAGIAVLAFAWVLTYAAMGRYLSAGIPLTFQLASLASLVLVARTQRFDAFRTLHLALMLVLPVLLQWSLGGFAASSGVP